MKNTKNEEKNIESVFNKKIDFKIYELIIFGFLIVLASVSLTFISIKSFSKSTDKLTTKSGTIEEFEEVYNLINNEYYKKVDKNKLINGAINGMLESLDDPHTSYFNKSETENFDDIMNGLYEGIGAEISLDNDNNVIVVSTLKNSPAKEVGLTYGDKIISVNGKSTNGMNTTEVVSLIKDPTIKKVKIKIERSGKELEYEIEKRAIIIESVESKTFNINNKKIGYVAINNFANNTYSQFRENIESLEKENIEGLVIDVRGNSGGYLHSVSGMLDMFLPKSSISYQIADNKKVYKYRVNSSESRNYPVAVLVNKASASASEILAVSLMESYGADVVGTVTYGKGTVQTTKKLESGGMIKYTIQKWLSPKGNWINDVGVKPTVEIELSEEYNNKPIEENDNQLQKALEVVSTKK